jgi:ABC-type phosphate transport system substrate-binding protein
MKVRNFVIFALAVTLCFTANLVWAGNIVIKGSTTVLPIAQKVAEIYMKVNPEVRSESGRNLYESKPGSENLYFWWWVR